MVAGRRLGSLRPNDRLAGLRGLGDVFRYTRHALDLVWSTSRPLTVALALLTLVAGVLPAAVRALRELGATEIAAWLGPCIHPECYAFGAVELDEIEARLGGRVRSTTATGELALDLPAAVARSLRSVEVELVDAAVGCTACDTRWFSHRARADAGRQALVAWIES